MVSYDDPLEDRLVIGVSTRALFDLDAENALFESEGLAAYRAFQKSHENDPLKPGTGFSLVRGLLGINGRSPAGPLVEVILVSRNDPDTSMRVFNSIDASRLAITRGVFRGGRDPWPFLRPFHCDLFLSAEPLAVQEALALGTPAALVLPPPASSTGEEEEGEVRIAFDGDSVLFDDESDRIWTQEGPDAFFRNEAEKADLPMSAGPFRPFLDGLARVQAQFPDGESPIRTALVTARNAPAHRRVINTFRSWGIRVDEAFFLGGVDKTEVVALFRPHMFLDDRLENLQRAAQMVPAAHVLTKIKQLDLFEIPKEAPKPRTSSVVAGNRKAPAAPRRSPRKPTGARPTPEALRTALEATAPVERQSVEEGVVDGGVPLLPVSPDEA